MPDQIDTETSARRTEIVMEIQMEISAQKGQSMSGQTLIVLCEGFDRYAESWFGRSASNAPDVDGKIFFTAEEKPRPGDYVKVRITEAMDYDLIGERVSG
jgi:ribosomal protein S12 methylthiotransferase